jgi:hypothetical protein
MVLGYSQLIWARFMEIAYWIRGELEWKPICLSSCR